MTTTTTVTDYGSNGTKNTMESNNKVANGDPGLTPVESQDVYQKKNGSAMVMVDEDDDLKQGDACCLTCCSPEGRPLFVILKLGICVIAGIIFGIALEKTRVFEPASIRFQMVLQRWIMLKMFLAAVATGQLALILMSVLPCTKAMWQEAMDGYASSFSEKGILTSVLGPFILGAGMTLSGACPGMVLAQVGSWTTNAIYTFIGVLIGALLYGLVAPFVIKITKPKEPFEKQLAHEKFNVPYFTLALPMAVLIGVVVFLMEYFIPWREDLAPESRNKPGNNNPFTVISWPPFAGGMLIGVLQILIVLAAQDTLGGSSSYMAIVSQWVVTDKLKEMFPYLAKYRCGLGTWWQLFYVCAAILGGAISSLGSGTIGTTKGANIPTAICGGIMLLLGARLAAGCTSGHGLSGMGVLAWLSFVAVPCMFAGGIVTGFSMQATGALCDFDCWDGTNCIDPLCQ